jgi:hypothetical protein
METPTKAHEVRVRIVKDAGENKWRIRVDGVTSGVRIHGNDGDNMAFEFALDASRFHPVLKNH